MLLEGVHQVMSGCPSFSSLPYIPPPPRAGCNAVAMVVMIAITVVATVATAGAAAAAMSSAGLSSFSMALRRLHMVV